MNSSQQVAKEKRDQQDLVLFQRVKDNSPGAQNDFYKRFKGVAYKYASRYTKNKNELEEIVQDSIQKGFEKIHADALRKPEQIGSLIISTAMSKARDLLDKKKAQKRGGGAYHQSIENILIQEPYRMPSSLVLPSYIDYGLIASEKEEIVENFIDQVSDPLLRSIIRLKIGGFRNRQIKELLSIPDKEFARLFKYHAKNQMRTIYRAVLQNKLVHISEITENRLDDLQLLFQSWTTDYKHFNSDLNFSLGVINEVLLGKLPASNDFDVMHFKAQVKLFLMELLINKALLNGQAGALHMSQDAFDLAVLVGDVEKQIKVKLAESIGWRIKKKYKMALGLLENARELTERLKDKRMRQVYLNQIEGEKGRVLSRTDLTKAARKHITHSSRFLQEFGSEESFLVKQVELADVNIQLGKFDESSKILHDISAALPEKHINLNVRYQRILADLHFATGDKTNALSSFRQSWEMSDKVVLRNQFRNLFDLMQKYKVHPQELLSIDEIKRGKSVSALI